MVAENFPQTRNGLISHSSLTDRALQKVAMQHFAHNLMQSAASPAVLWIHAGACGKDLNPSPLTQGRSLHAFLFTCIRFIKISVHQK